MQRCHAEWQQKDANCDYDKLLKLAKEAVPFKCFVDLDDSIFLNPPNMQQAIIEYCNKTNQPQPETIGEFVRCILESLAFKYRYLIDKLNFLKGEPIETLHIVGGGSRNSMLNQFTANATGLQVIAGPAEATALGNIIIQAIAKQDLNNVQEGRELISRISELREYIPTEHAKWEEKYINASKLF